MPPIIRKYTAADLQAVMSSWEHASKIAHPFLPDEFVEKVRHDIPNLYLPNADTWVAEVDGVVLGFIALTGNEIGAIFVEPSHHGSGTGRSLMDKAREIHANPEVEVFKENSIGRRFYARYGFELLNESIHPETGNPVLRLKYTADKDRRED